jgi:hypothetical protein
LWLSIWVFSESLFARVTWVSKISCRLWSIFHLIWEETSTEPHNCPSPAWYGALSELIIIHLASKNALLFWDLMPVYAHRRQIRWWQQSLSKNSEELWLVSLLKYWSVLQREEQVARNLFEIATSRSKSALQTIGQEYKRDLIQRIAWRLVALFNDKVVCSESLIINW